MPAWLAQPVMSEQTKLLGASTAGLREPIVEHVFVAERWLRLGLAMGCLIIRVARWACWTLSRPMPVLIGVQGRG
jgi:hypothetical protein